MGLSVGFSVVAFLGGSGGIGTTGFFRTFSGTAAGVVDATFGGTGSFEIVCFFDRLSRLTDIVLTAGFIANGLIHWC